MNIITPYCEKQQEDLHLQSTTIHCLGNLFKLNYSSSSESHFNFNLFQFLFSFLFPYYSSFKVSSTSSSSNSTLAKEESLHVSCSRTILILCHFVPKNKILNLLSPFLPNLASNFCSLIFYTKNPYIQHHSFQFLSFFVSICPKEVFDHWKLIFPHLFTSINSQFAPDLKITALSTITCILQHSKTFLIAVSDIPRRNEAKTPNFISYSETLAQTVKSMHDELIKIIDTSVSSDLIVEAYKALEQLVVGVPYDKLAPGTLKKVMDKINTTLNSWILDNAVVNQNIVERSLTLLKFVFAKSFVEAQTILMSDLSSITENKSNNSNKTDMSIIEAMIFLVEDVEMNNEIKTRVMEAMSEMVLHYVDCFVKIWTKVFRVIETVVFESKDQELKLACVKVLENLIKAFKVRFPLYYKQKISDDDNNVNDHKNNNYRNNNNSSNNNIKDSEENMITKGVEVAGDKKYVDILNCVIESHNASGQTLVSLLISSSSHLIRCSIFSLLSLFPAMYRFALFFSNMLPTLSSVVSSETSPLAKTCLLSVFESLVGFPNFLLTHYSVFKSILFQIVPELIHCKTFTLRHKTITFISQFLHVFTTQQKQFNNPYPKILSFLYQNLNPKTEVNNKIKANIIRALGAFGRMDLKQLEENRIEFNRQNVMDTLTNLYLDVLKSDKQVAKTKWNAANSLKIMITFNYNTMVSNDQNKTKFLGVIKILMDALQQNENYKVKLNVLKVLQVRQWKREEYGYLYREVVEAMLKVLKMMGFEYTGTEVYFEVKEKLKKNLRRQLMLAVSLRSALDTEWLDKWIQENAKELSDIILGYLQNDEASEDEDSESGCKMQIHSQVEKGIDLMMRTWSKERQLEKYVVKIKAWEESGKLYPG